MSYTNGERYEGSWKTDYKQGEGILYYPDGSYRKGTFEKGSMEGTVTMVDNDGTATIEEWR